MKEKQVILICGSRGFPQSLVIDWCNLHINPTDHIVIHGGCPNSPDEYWCSLVNLNTVYGVFPANWAGQGKAAGIIRNKAMVQICDRVVAFWDMKSRGTKSTIDFAREAKKPVTIINNGWSEISVDSEMRDGPSSKDKSVLSGVE